MTDLRFCLRSAYEYGEKEHPQSVMRNLCVSYIYGVPQSIADQWWFLGCENVPKELPPYLTPMELKYNDMVGYGLSQEMADNLNRGSPTVLTSKE